MNWLRITRYSVLALAMLPAAARAQVGIEQVQKGATQTSQGARNTDAFDQILATLQARSGSSTFAAPAASFSPSASPSSAGGLLANQAILNQYGQGNTGTITQNGQSNAASALVIGDRNVTTQTQTGSNNLSLLGINGNGNSANVSSTGALGLSGDNNSSAYAIVGNNNVLTSTQMGSNLSYGLAIIGSGKNITVTQDGTGTQTTRGIPTLSPGVAAAIPGLVGSGTTGR